MKKRVFSIFMLAIAMSVFTACGTKENTNDTIGLESKNSSNEKKVEDKDMEVEVTANRQKIM